MEKLSREEIRKKYREEQLLAKLKTQIGYGWCPVCGEEGVSAERSPDGNTVCVNGHEYKHSERRYD